MMASRSCRRCKASISACVPTCDDDYGNCDTGGWWMTGTTGSYNTVCEGALREFPANAPCDLGRVKANGASNQTGQPSDIRNYRFTVTELDDGTNQSEFKGWAVRFSLVFNARLPAVPDAPSPFGLR
jgi:hypothetical protein